MSIPIVLLPGDDYQTRAELEGVVDGGEEIKNQDMRTEGGKDLTEVFNRTKERFCVVLDDPRDFNLHVLACKIESRILKEKICEGKQETLREQLQDVGITIFGMEVFGLSEHGLVIEAVTEMLPDGLVDRQVKEQPNDSSSVLLNV